MYHMVLVEICTDNLQDTLEAIRAGADRIELCSDLDLDGLTPRGCLLQQVLPLGRAHGVPIFTMVRNRPGNFVYSNEEKHDMIQTALRLCMYGVDGLVVGALMDDMRPDFSFMEKLCNKVRTVRPDIQITFHKAIDAVHARDGEEFSEIVSEVGRYCNRVLSSGGCQTALEGTGKLRACVETNASPIVIAAGKIREANVDQIVKLTGVSEVHSRSSTICRALNKAVRKIY